MIQRSFVISFPVMEWCWLQTWLHKSGMLPQGWVDVSQHSDPSSNSDVVLCKPRPQPLQSVTIGFTLRVEPDFCWKLYLSSEELHSCLLLSSVPEHLNTVSQTVSLTMPRYVRIMQMPSSISSLAGIRESSWIPHESVLCVPSL